MAKLKKKPTSSTIGFSSGSFGKAPELSVELPEVEPLVSKGLKAPKPPSPRAFGSGGGSAGIPQISDPLTLEQKLAALETIRNTLFPQEGTVDPNNVNQHLPEDAFQEALTLDKSVPLGPLPEEFGNLPVEQGLPAAPPPAPPAPPAAPPPPPEPPPPTETASGGA